MIALRTSRLERLPVQNGLLICALLAIMTAHLATLVMLPQVYIDEPWQSNAAWTWLTTGVNFDSIHSGALDQFGWPGVRRPMLGGLPWVLVFAGGGLGLFQARFVSWMFGLATLALTVVIGRQLYSLGAGLLAALILALTFAFTQASHYARQDIMLTTFVLGALSLSLGGINTGRNWLHVAAGLVLGLSIDVHQYGAFFVPPFVGLYLVRYGRAVLKTPAAWLFSSGLVLGLLYFAAVHLLVAPDVFLRLSGFDAVYSRRPPILSGSLQAFMQALVADVKLYRFGRNPVFALLLAVGVLGLLHRRNPSDRLLLTWFMVGLATLALLNGKKSDLYAIHLHPLMSLVLVGGATAVPGYGRRAVRLAVQLGVVAVLATGLYRFVSSARSNIGYDYYVLTGQISAHLHPGARVMASPVYWLGLNGYDYRSVMNVPYHAYFNGMNRFEAIQREHPDYLLIDLHFAEIVGDYAGIHKQGRENAYDIPDGGLGEFLKSKSKVIAVIDNQWHGPVHIYQLDWGRNTQTDAEDGSRSDYLTTRKYR
jgi:4-amino-4-deoxy-L-arabinose transferase-like glycosyltransferase